MENKAQASTEYLVILAVVIVVAVVVASLIGGFINFGSGSTSGKTAKLYWSNADIALLDWVMSADGADTLVVQNNLNYDIYLKNITVNGVGREPNMTLIKHAQKTITKDWVECEPGAGYSYLVTFLYDNTEFGIFNKTFTGAEKLTGTCQ